MGRKTGEPTKVERLRMADAVKIRAIALDRGLKFRDALRQLAGKNIDRAYRRVVQRQNTDMGNPVG